MPKRIRVVSRLASLSERLSSVIQALSGNSTTAKYCAALKKAAQETEDHRQYMKNLETVLTEICTTYQNYDKKAGQALASQTAGGASISFRKEENTTSSTAGTGAEEGMDLLKEAVEGVKSNKENAKELLQQHGKRSMTAWMKKNRKRWISGQENCSGMN